MADVCKSLPPCLPEERRDEKATSPSPPSLSPLVTSCATSSRASASPASSTSSRSSLRFSDFSHYSLSPASASSCSPSPASSSSASADASSSPYSSSVSASVALLVDEAEMASPFCHAGSATHPESPSRIVAILETLLRHGWVSRRDRGVPRRGEATPEQAKRTEEPLPFGNSPDLARCGSEAPLARGPSGSRSEECTFPVSLSPFDRSSAPSSLSPPDGDLRFSPSPDCSASEAVRGGHRGSPTAAPSSFPFYSTCPRLVVLPCARLATDEELRVCHTADYIARIDSVFPSSLASPGSSLRKAPAKAGQGKEKKPLQAASALPDRLKKGRKWSAHNPDLDCKSTSCHSPSASSSDSPSVSEPSSAPSPSSRASVRRLPSPPLARPKGSATDRAQATCEDAVPSRKPHAETEGPAGRGGSWADPTERGDEKKVLGAHPAPPSLPSSLFPTAPSSLSQAMEDASGAGAACALAAPLEAAEHCETDATPPSSSAFLASPSPTALSTQPSTASASPSVRQYVSPFGRDTFICPRTPHTARLAAGAALALCDLVLGPPASLGRPRETRRKKKGKRKEELQERQQEGHQERQQEGHQEGQHEGHQEAKPEQWEAETGDQARGLGEAAEGVASERQQMASSFEEIERLEGEREDVPAATERGEGVLHAGEKPQENTVKRGFAIIRPPGHHACSNEAAGFCIYNNVALAANYLLTKHGLSRVAILDWDVHHGNGTQDLFYNSSSVLYVSVHRYDKAKPASSTQADAADAASSSLNASDTEPSAVPSASSASPASSAGAGFYPGTGALTETGVAAGRGYTINIPLSKGYTDGDMFWAFCGIVAPALTAFRPQVILVSAGFDAAAGDPLGGCFLSPPLFAWMTRQVCRLADLHCGGKALFFLEGGYNGDVLGTCVEACVAALVGAETAVDGDMRAGPAPHIAAEDAVYGMHAEGDDGRREESPDSGEASESAGRAGHAEEEQEPTARRPSQTGASDTCADTGSRTLQESQGTSLRKPQGESSFCCSSPLSLRLGETLARLDLGILEGVEPAVASSKFLDVRSPHASVSLPVSPLVHGASRWSPFCASTPASPEFSSRACPLPPFALPLLFDERAAILCPKCRWLSHNKARLPSSRSRSTSIACCATASSTQRTGDAVCGPPPAGTRSRGPAFEQLSAVCKAGLSFFVEKRTHAKFVPDPFPPGERWAVISPAAVDLAMRDAADVSPLGTGNVASWAPIATAETGGKTKGRGDEKRSRGDGKKKGQDAKGRKEARKREAPKADCETARRREEAHCLQQGVASDVETGAAQGTPLSLSESCVSPRSPCSLPACRAASERFASAGAVCPTCTVCSPFFSTVSPAPGSPTACPQWRSQPSSPSPFLSISRKAWGSSATAGPSRPAEGEPFASAAVPTSRGGNALCSAVLFGAIAEDEFEATAPECQDALASLCAPQLEGTTQLCPHAPALVCAACGVSLEPAEIAFPSSAPASPTQSSSSAAASPVGSAAGPGGSLSSERVGAERGEDAQEALSERQKLVVCRQATYDSLRLVRHLHARSPFFLPPLPPLPKTVKTKNGPPASETADAAAERSAQIEFQLRVDPPGDAEEASTQGRDTSEANDGEDGTDGRHSGHKDRKISDRTTEEQRRDGKPNTTLTMRGGQGDKEEQTAELRETGDERGGDTNQTVCVSSLISTSSSMMASPGPHAASAAPCGSRRPTSTPSSSADSWTVSAALSPSPASYPPRASSSCASVPSSPLLPSSSRPLANVFPAGWLSHVRCRIVGGRVNRWLLPSICADEVHARGAKLGRTTALAKNDCIKQGQLVKLCSWSEAAFYTWVHVHAAKAESGATTETRSSEKAHEAAGTLQALEALFRRLKRPDDGAGEGRIQDKTALGVHDRPSQEDHERNGEGIAFHASLTPHHEALESAVLSFDPEQVLELLRIRPDALSLRGPQAASRDLPPSPSGSAASLSHASLSPSRPSPDSGSSNVATELAKFMPRCHRVFWTHAWALAEPSTSKEAGEGGRKRDPGDETEGEAGEEAGGEERNSGTRPETREVSAAPSAVSALARLQLETPECTGPDVLPALSPRQPASASSSAPRSSSPSSSASCVPVSPLAPVSSSAAGSVSPTCGSRFACAVALEDVAQFVRPCVMDIKMGIQMYDPSCTDVVKIQRMQEKARGRSVASHGFFICGVSAGAVDTAGAPGTQAAGEAGEEAQAESKDKEQFFGTDATGEEARQGGGYAENVVSSLRPFVLSKQDAYAVTQDAEFLRVFANFFCVNRCPQLAARLIRKCLDRLATLQRLFEQQAQVAFYGSSLLFVFDAGPAPAATSPGSAPSTDASAVFAWPQRTGRMEAATKEEHKVGNSGGPETRVRRHGEAGSAVCADSPRVNQDNEALHDAIVESFGAYMVDFAHVNFSHRQQDRGYLFGLSNLQRLFARVLDSLAPSPPHASVEPAPESKSKDTARKEETGAREEPGETYGPGEGGKAEQQEGRP
ncbi:hypothetical protein NCLIV_023370 [Neospora caninum Liverpool]|uniref:histone deacetylase n=1 Tax=Neospora caninum (strain Liverpool) TaxID=572307 RepID=F0VFQ5_NEOCL|nr:hypothetical protein NCLIV_023370 [Neospora caninum Liverpool]CBZ52549.1 hypothetical protein NCLIV_023370 [Neospora caninum Liverpool]CEL66525.1 TPA: Histone deacetylase 15 [Neospora caninum Liverpool]|eukprot:XP_003882581.1 hypothetical protein NCLIV_023370 [Neospora caninum Liverpool]